MSIFTDLANLTMLTPNEKALVHYLKKHTKEVLNMTPSELAEASYVSVATVYRLLSKVGISGFNELKIALASTIREETLEIDPNYPILETDTPEETVSRMSALYQQTLDDTINLVDTNSLKRSVDLLLRAKMIDIYSSSANVHFAQNFKFQLQEIGYLINVPEEDYVQKLSAANSTEGHVAIVVSYGGRGQTTKEVLRILKENQTPVILITSTQNNPFLSYATEKLFLSSIENHYNKISSFSTRFSLLMVFDLLYAGIFNQDAEKHKEYKLTNYRKMNRGLR